MALLLLNSLQDPQLVAQFQRSCGLTFLQPNGEANGHSNAQTLQGGREKGVPQENGHKSYSNGSYSNGTLKQMPARKYVVHNYVLYYLFRFAAALGQEIFYITFMPFILWNIDSFIARRMIYVWCIVMYIGQASKDILKWPRPSSPPVVKLETRVEAEYGMPSTHTIAATAISFTFLLASVGRYQFPFLLGFVVALCLSTLVSLSRLYTGMHTVLDVICGAVFALVFLAVTFPAWDFFDHLVMTNPLCPVVAVIVAFLLSYNYPKLDHYSTTRADTTVILGAGAGTCIGVWLINYLGLTYVPTGLFPLSIPPISSDMLLKHLARFVLGVTVLGVTRYIAKTLSLKALGLWYNVSTQSQLVRQRLEIEVPYKFVTYTSIGVIAISFVPWVCHMLDL
ncbi:sphingosine-1-phosphate phosphatase 2 [Pseudophryne corroboree]|uniref:sphingosine-1-phosphate phosphatase 2 n=1 Tax=Pseudophryne corroboree TaxID=495146 RepID=UPI003081D7A9